MADNWTVAYYSVSRDWHSCLRKLFACTGFVLHDAN